MSTNAVNPLVLNRLVMDNTELTSDDLYGRSQVEPRPFARQVLVYAYIAHAGFSHAGAAQCLLRESHSSAGDAIKAIAAGKLDERARHYLPECDDAKDYASIMFDRALNTPLPKHRRAVAS